MRFSKSVVFFYALMTLITGCSIHSRPVPYGYDGPTATVVEGMEPRDDGSGSIFVISKIDGEKVHNAIFNLEVQEGYRQSYRQKIYPSAKGVKIPARKQKVVIVASRYSIGSKGTYASETPSRHSGVFGEVEFEPKADKFYRVNGKIEVRGSEVWIEDYETKQPVTAIVRNF